MPHCERAPDCGDGYACDRNGICQLATGQAGDACTSEAECAAGLACELSNDMLDDQGQLMWSCEPETAGRPAGDVCSVDADCREHTCALGHCVTHCNDTLDCATGTACTAIPRIDEKTGTVFAAMFQGCLLSHGTLEWSLPIQAPAKTLLLPSPGSARQLAVTFAVDDPAQEVGAVSLVSPTGVTLIDPTAPTIYANLVRHAPQIEQSVMVMPSTPAALLEAGAYTMRVSSLRADGTTPGSAIPRATVVAKLDQSVLLDLHFYFLNFEDHPCMNAFGKLDAAAAESASFFQNDYLGMLRVVFAKGGISLGTITFEDLPNHPDLDGLDITDAPSLLSLGTHTTGINVYFVRTMRPAGLQAFGPNPGPAGLAGTRQSGVIVSLDTLCYEGWSDVARLTAHELARYMGLYANVELDGHLDPIDDTDASSDNLMYFSDAFGTDLSAGQREILTRSAVLR